MPKVTLCEDHPGERLRTPALIPSTASHDSSRSLPRTRQPMTYYMSIEESMGERTPAGDKNSTRDQEKLRLRFDLILHDGTTRAVRILPSLGNRRRVLEPEAKKQKSVMELGLDLEYEHEPVGGHGIRPVRATPAFPRLARRRRCGLVPASGLRSGPGIARVDSGPGRVRTGARP